MRKGADRYIMFQKKDKYTTELIIKENKRLLRENERLKNEIDKIKNLKEDYEKLICDLQQCKAKYQQKLEEFDVLETNFREEFTRISK